MCLIILIANPPPCLQFLALWREKKKEQKDHHTWISTLACHPWNSAEKLIHQTLLKEQCGCVYFLLKRITLLPKQTRFEKLAQDRQFGKLIYACFVSRKLKTVLVFWCGHCVTNNYRFMHIAS